MYFLENGFDLEHIMRFMHVTLHFSRKCPVTSKLIIIHTLPVCPVGKLIGCALFTGELTDIRIKGSRRTTPTDELLTFTRRVNQSHNLK